MFSLTLSLIGWDSSFCHLYSAGRLFIWCQQSESHLSFKKLICWKSWVIHHLDLNGRSIHTMSRFIALGELESCHRRPLPLHGPSLVRLPICFITACPWHSQYSTLVLVHLGTQFFVAWYCLRNRCLNSWSSVDYVSYIPFFFKSSVPSHVLTVAAETISIFGFCQSLWGSG